MNLHYNETQFKTFIMLFIPLSILYANDGIFSVKSTFPVIVLLFCGDLTLGKFRICKDGVIVFALFIFVSFCALLQNLFFTPELITSQTFIRIIYQAVILYLYYSITHTRYTEEQLHKITLACIGAGVCVSIYLTFINHIWFISLLGVRVDKNFVGAILAIEAELALLKFFRCSIAKQKIFFLLCYLIIVLGIFFSASRASVLVIILGSALIVFAGIGGVCKTRKQFQIAILMITALPIIFATFLIVLQNKMSGASMSIQWYWNRYFVNGFKDRSVSVRWEWWREAISLFQDRPLWGYGIGNIYLTGNSSAVSHNTYVDFLLDQGIIGFLTFIYIIYKSVKRILFKKMRQYYGVVATVLLSSFILSATRSTFLWFSLIMLHSVGNTIKE